MINGLTNTIKVNGINLAFHKIINATSDLISQTTHVWLGSYVDQPTADANPQGYIIQHDWIFPGYGLTTDQLYQAITAYSEPLMVTPDIPAVAAIPPVYADDGITVITPGVAGSPEVPATYRETNMFFGATTC